MNVKLMVGIVAYALWGAVLIEGVNIISSSFEGYFGAILAIGAGVAYITISLLISIYFSEGQRDV